MKAYPYILCSLFFCLFGTILLASATLDFEKGNQAYQEKDYEAAISSYEKILAADLRSKELHYNLGNAYLQLKKLGPAILHLEKALVISPYDKDIRFNLKLAKSQRKDEFGKLPPFFLKIWWVTARDWFSPTSWAVLTLLLFWLGVLGMVGWLLYTTRQSKKRSFLAGWTALILGGLCLCLSLARLSYVKESGYAILMTPAQQLHEGPDADSPEMLNLHEGTKVEIQDKIGEWYEVRLVNGEVGWLPVDVLVGI